MDLAQLIAQSRTCRRFTGPFLTTKILQAIVDCARLSPSARNMQPLRYVTISDQASCRTMFGMFVFGGALSAAQRPTPEQMPRGYIAITGPKATDPLSAIDIGIAAQSMFLKAGESGLGCCMLGAFNKQKLAAFLGLPEELETKLVLAFGTPAEKRKVVGRRPDGMLTYYRDENDEHCVPKLTREEVILRSL